MDMLLISYISGKKLNSPFFHLFLLPPFSLLSSSIICILPSFTFTGISRLSLLCCLPFQFPDYQSVWREMIGYILLAIILFQPIRTNGIKRLATLEGGIPIEPVPPHPKKWMTLSGNRPEIVAQGGYSGFFPDSSPVAYSFASDISVPDVILYCNVHFSKDNHGFCSPDINLANVTFIEEIDPRGQKTYNIYGHEVCGWFGFDYPGHFLYSNVTLHQNIFSRPNTFDAAPITGPLNIKKGKFNHPVRLWLNIENDMFYNQHNISPERYLLHEMKKLPEFLSSPEVGFLKAIRPKLGGHKTKLVFVFLEETKVEPTTNTPYGLLLKNLPMIKSIACGIVVPKEYIWPVSKERCLLPATTMVQDAHKLGLTVYASGFSNDHFLSYNYSFDPVREYLQFVDNGQFSVDGLLSSFPSTASEAVGCINTDPKAPREIETLIISHNGASGDFPGATDLAFQKAINDGADIIDCSVQMTKDGTAFCLDRPDLMKTTTAAALYMDLLTNNADIQVADGIFSFDLEWSEIQSLKPQMESFFDDPGLFRNPAHKNCGKFVTLAEFLQIATTKAASGVLINIRNAAFLAKKCLDIVGTVQTELNNAKFDKQKVMIQSDDTSVLLKFKDKPHYERVLYIEPALSGATLQDAEKLKNYADSVFVHRDAITVASDNFAFNFTNMVPSLQAANISVYVGYLRNEFANLIFDYLSDPYVEITTLVSLHVKGIVADFPATASILERSSCMIPGSPYVINPMRPGFLHSPEPVEEPPLLNLKDIVKGPLPEVAKNSTPAPSPSTTTTPPPPDQKKSSSSSITVGTAGLFWSMRVAALV